MSGALIALLGAWGALIPFIGPTFNYVIGPDQSWHWTSGRLWLSVLPGAVAILGGLLLMTSGRRPTALLGALMGVAAGAWFVVGPTVSELWNHGVSQAGAAHGDRGLRVLEQLGWFSALGALIVYFGAAALGRLSVKSVRDIELAEADAATAQADAGPATRRPAAGAVTTERADRREAQPVAASATGARASEATSATTSSPQAPAASPRTAGPAGSGGGRRRSGLLGRLRPRN